MTTDSETWTPDDYELMCRNERAILAIRVSFAQPPPPPANASMIRDRILLGIKGERLSRKRHRCRIVSNLDLAVGCVFCIAPCWLYYCSIVSVWSKRGKILLGDVKTNHLNPSQYPSQSGRIRSYARHFGQESRKRGISVQQRICPLRGF